MAPAMAPTKATAMPAKLAEPTRATAALEVGEGAEPVGAPEPEDVLLVAPPLEVGVLEPEEVLLATRRKAETSTVSRKYTTEDKEG